MSGLKQRMKLYRYLPAASAIKTIENRSFRVSRIVELNDPFEWTFGFDGSRPETVDEDRRGRDRLIEHLNKRYGVICFCEGAKDPVVWSHYADGHRGIAIEVAAEQDGSLIPVEYSGERLVLPQHWVENREQHKEDLKEIFGKLFRFKAPSWRYEREVRLLVPLDKCDVADGMFFLKTPDNFITRLIIGIRSPVGLEYVRRSLDIHGFTDVQAVKATENLNRYEIDF